MTPAEFRTIREACGLTAYSAAEFFDVARKSINNYEAGKRDIPPGLAQELIDLDMTIETAAKEVLSLTDKLSKKHGKPEIIGLTRYTDDNLHKSQPGTYELLKFACVHNAMNNRARHLLINAGYKVDINFFED